MYDTGINSSMKITVGKEAKHVTAGSDSTVKLNTNMNSSGPKKSNVKNVSAEYTDELRKQLGDKNG